MSKRKADQGPVAENDAVDPAPSAKKPAVEITGPGGLVNPKRIRTLKGGSVSKGPVLLWYACTLLPASWQATFPTSKPCIPANMCLYMCADSRTSGLRASWTRASLLHDVAPHADSPSATHGVLHSQSRLPPPKPPYLTPNAIHHVHCKIQDNLVACSQDVSRPAA